MTRNKCSERFMIWCMEAMFSPQPLGWMLDWLIDGSSFCESYTCIQELKEVPTIWTKMLDRFTI